MGISAKVIPSDLNRWPNGEFDNVILIILCVNFKLIMGCFYSCFANQSRRNDTSDIYLVDECTPHDSSYGAPSVPSITYHDHQPPYSPQYYRYSLYEPQIYNYEY